MSRPIPKWRRYLRLLGIDIRSDVEDELRFHLEAKRDELIARGAPPDAASQEAERRFGDIDSVRRICVHIEQGRVRKMNWNERISNWLHDLKYAARQLRKSPGFTLTAILSLALGIGANTAIFTLTDQILLRLLPVENPRELVQLRVDGGHVGAQSGDGVHTFSYPAFLAMRERNTLFSGLTAQAVNSAGFGVNGRNELLNVGMVAGNYFDVLGVKPAIGRLMTADDDRVEMGAPVAVVRYEFWRSRLGGNPAIAGFKIQLNGYPFTVIGVAAEGFEGTIEGYPTNIWIPVTMKRAINPVDNPSTNERYTWLSLFGRLKPGVTIAQAEAAMKVLYRQRQEEELTLPYFQRNPDARGRFLKQTFALEPAERGESALRARFEKPLLLLQWVVGAVLLIACSNIAGLLLARGAGRQREIAIRSSLGAGRSRLVGQLLTESLLLAGISGVVGVAIGTWATRVLLQLLTVDPSRTSLSVTPDLRILLFATAITLATTVIFGLLPAWQASRPAAAALKESTGLGGGHSQARLRKAFVAFQVALSTLLLICAGLFARTLGNLRGIDLGFDTENIATFTVMPATEYADARKLQVFRSVVEGLAEVPGVRAVGANSTRLLTGGRSDGAIQLPGVDPRTTSSFFNAITPGYFEALGIRIEAGHGLTWRDWGTGHKYAVVNRELKDQYLEGRNPVGTMLGRDADGPLDYEVVGVFSNARYHDPRGPIPPQTFFAMDSRIHFTSAINIYARVQGDPAAIMPALRERVRQVDSNLIVANPGTLASVLNLRLANERMLATFSEAFGLLALVLAATGLYGVLSYVVGRREREIGIRMALGARRAGVVRLVVSEVATVVICGVAAGVVGAALGGRYVESQLYGVKGSDTLVFLQSVTALAVCALLATAFPAWRASRLDPTRALRHE